MSLYEVIGRNKPEYLLADPAGADIIAIPCKPREGFVPRGTVMYRGEDGMYLAASAAEAVDGKHLAVLDESVDTNAGGNVAEDARAFRAGKLIFGRVMLKDDAPLTDAAVLALRKQGIVFDRMESTETFKNTTET